MGTVPGYIAEMQLTNMRPNLSNLLRVHALPATAAIHATAACAARTAGTARAAKAIPDTTWKLENRGDDSEWRLQRRVL